MNRVKPACTPKSCPARPKLLHVLCIVVVGWVARTLHLDVQFTVFLFVGALNTVVGYALYVLFVWLGLGYVFAPLCSTVAGVLFNFQTIGRLVFNSKDNRLIGRFLGVYAVVYVLNVTGLKAFELAGLANLYIAGLLLALPLALLSFVLNKKWVFPKKDAAHKIL